MGIEILADFEKDDFQVVVGVKGCVFCIKQSFLFSKKVVIQARMGRGKKSTNECSLHRTLRAHALKKRARALWQVFMGSAARGPPVGRQVIKAVGYLSCFKLTSMC